MRLHIGCVCSKNLFDAVNGQLLCHVHVFAPAVIALAGVAFCVFVGELRALGLHDGGRGVVFAGDQLDVVLLSRVFSLDSGPQFGVGLFDQDVAVVHAGSPNRGGPGVPNHRHRAAQANGKTPQGLRLRASQWSKLHVSGAGQGPSTPIASRARG